jgi:hypothetical protein
MFFIIVVPSFVSTFDSKIVPVQTSHVKAVAKTTRFLPWRKATSPQRHVPGDPRKNGIAQKTRGRVGNVVSLKNVSFIS